MKSGRRSRQREVILEELRNTTTHPTADNIYHAVRRRLPNVSLGTVYRNLELLCDEGRARKVNCAAPKRRYDGNVEPHHHVRCIRCERIMDLTGINAPDLRHAAAAESGFRIADFSIDFTGVCASCT